MPLLLFNDHSLFKGVIHLSSVFLTTRFFSDLTIYGDVFQRLTKYVLLLETNIKFQSIRCVQEMQKALVTSSICLRMKEALVEEMQT